MDKSFLLSKTVWGLVLAVASPIAARYGFTIDEAAWVNDIVTALGAALAIYGRFTATKELRVV